MTTVTVNGRERELEPGETLEALIRRLGLDGRYVLVERNGEAVDRKDYSRLEIESGDTLVVARPVAGG